MIKHSVNIHRGCFGGCAFCTISAHQGKFISCRSKENILREVRNVFVYDGYTLTINGGGKLIASSNGHGAGIGGGWNISCGNIDIQGGIIEATGGQYAAGIGGGYIRNCGTITITDGVTRVTATKGTDAPNSIGIGFRDNENTCGTVTIGGTVYWQNNAYVGDGETYLKQSQIVYPAP